MVRESLPEDARVVKELGDGLLLWFADPRAALETALTLSNRFEALDEQSMVPVGVRIGINWGQYLRRGEDIVGHCVNVASRIVNVAGPGEVLVSDSLLAEVESKVNGVEFDELGPVVMKGIPEPVRLFRAYRCPPD
jgi:adenylate cyclase